MKMFAISALAATFVLGACAEAEAPGTEETAITEDGTVTETAVVPAPAATETTIVREVDTDADSGDRVSIDEDGVNADLGNGDTRVQAEIDGDPSLTVETD